MIDSDLKNKLLYLSFVLEQNIKTDVYKISRGKIVMMYTTEVLGSVNPLGFILSDFRERENFIATN